MKFYAFEYFSGRNTTTGYPNPTTGCMSIAGFVAVFATRSARNAWVDAGAVTSDMAGNCREAVTAKEARSLKQGMTLPDYAEMIECSLDQE